MLGRMQTVVLDAAGRVVRYFRTRMHWATGPAFLKTIHREMSVGTAVHLGKRPRHQSVTGLLQAPHANSQLLDGFIQELANWPGHLSQNLSAKRGSTRAFRRETD
jgi:hypothetical protein